MANHNKRIARQRKPRLEAGSEAATADAQQLAPVARQNAPFHLPPSLRESVYSHLKERIIHNSISPGTMLYVDRLATELGVSRTPVREALLWLEGDRLVESTHKHGFVVTRVERRDIENVYQVRMLLEAEAVARAAERIPAAVLASLAELFARAEAEIELGRYESYMQCDQVLHLTVLDHAANPVLAQIAQSLFERSLRIRHLAEGEAAEHAELIMAEHLAILAALSSRDSGGSREAMLRHLTQACARALDHADHLQAADPQAPYEGSVPAD